MPTSQHSEDGLHTGFSEDGPHAGIDREQQPRLAAAPDTAREIDPEQVPEQADTRADRAADRVRRPHRPPGRGGRRRIGDRALQTVRPAGRSGHARAHERAPQVAGEVEIGERETVAAIAAIRMPRQRVPPADQEPVLRRGRAERHAAGNDQLGHAAPVERAVPHRDIEARHREAVPLERARGQREAGAPREAGRLPQRPLDREPSRERGAFIRRQHGTECGIAERRRLVRERGRVMTFRGAAQRELPVRREPPLDRQAGAGREEEVRVVVARERCQRVDHARRARPHANVARLVHERVQPEPRSRAHLPPEPRDRDRVRRAERVAARHLDAARGTGRERAAPAEEQAFRPAETQRGRGGRQTQPEPRQPAQRLLPDQRGRARAQVLHLRRRGEPGLVQVLVDAAVERVRLALRLRHRDDRVAQEHRRGQVLVELVVRDAEPALDHGRHHEVQLGHLPPDLDRLLVRQPVAALPETVVERDVDVIEPAVHVGDGRERERHPHDVARDVIDEHRADDRGPVRRLV